MINAIKNALGFGPKVDYKELIKKGVITNEGGFIGIGSMKKLSENFNHQNFSEIDITKLKIIKLEAQKVKLITTHVADSYSIVKTDDGCSLYIQNAEKFWSMYKNNHISLCRVLKYLTDSKVLLSILVILGRMNCGPC